MLKPLGDRVVLKAETEEEIIDLAQSMAINLYQELAIANNWMIWEDCLVEAEKQINVKNFDSYDQYGETLEELTDEFFLDGCHGGLR